MECAVRCPVPAIWADTDSESTDCSNKYQPDRYTSAWSHNVTAVSHTQGCPDQYAHRSSSGIPRVLGLRTTSISPDYCHKEFHAENPCDTHNAHCQTDSYDADDSHPYHRHFTPPGNTPDSLLSFAATPAPHQ